MVAYFRPATLAQALELRASRPLQILAGATDVYPAKTTRAGWGETRHADVLDISAIPGLKSITHADDHWRIGAMTTWTDIIRADLPEAFDGLKQASAEIGGVQIQNRGTLAGNICNASPAADGVPCLLALDAAVEIASIGGTRIVPLREFIDGYRHTVLSAGEIVTAIRVPRQTGRGCFLKLGARKYLVISITMVSAVIDLAPGRTIRSVRLAIGSCSAVAQRMVDLERALLHQPIDRAPEQLAPEALFENLSPIDDIRASGVYRQHAAVALTRDLLRTYQSSDDVRAA